MNAEIQKLIDGLPTRIIVDRTIIDGIKYKVIKEYLLESDVIELVESLTKWNKVEDCLPELISTRSHQSRQVFCKLKDGSFKVCQFSNALGFYPLYANEKVTEWKPIN